MDIDKSIWSNCCICNSSINEIKSEFGKSGKYNTQNFKDHLIKYHNISYQEYFIKYNLVPKIICPCGICNNILYVVLDKSKYRLSKYACGRSPGQIKWSNEAKISRLGKNNPMFGKIPWNKSLTKESHSSLQKLSDINLGKIISEESKNRMSKSAKIRKVHGHTGLKHSEESKKKMSEATIKRMQNGEFKFTKTKPHIYLCDILKSMDIEFVEEYNISYWLFDIFIPSLNLLVEVDGDYWHSNPKIYPNGPISNAQKINYTRDIKKNSFCKTNNLNLIRLWESDILNDKIEELICILKK